MIKQVRPNLSSHGRYQRSIAEGGRRLAATPSTDIQIIPKITQFLQAHTRWDYGADEIATDLPRGSGGGVSAQCDATAKKDGSDPISTRRHFAERLNGTGKM